MACDEMQKWEEVEKEVERVVEIMPDAPPKQEILEEIHQETHRLVDLQKLLSGKPNLKRREMEPLIKAAAKRILDRLRKENGKANQLQSPLFAVRHR